MPLWKTINRLKAEIAKTRVNMMKWGYKEGLNTYVNTARTIR